MQEHATTKLSTVCMSSVHVYCCAQGADREPIYCAELGLAVEQLKEGLTVEQLWSVL